METWDAIRARRNVRDYRPEPVPDADLERIVESAWRAPSARNNQHWDFVAVTDTAQLRELSTVWAGAAHIAHAPAAIALVVPVPGDEREKLIDQFDLGQAMAGGLPGHHHARRPVPAADHRRHERDHCHASGRGA